MLRLAPIGRQRGAFQIRNAVSPLMPRRQPVPGIPALFPLSDNWDGNLIDGAKWTVGNFADPSGTTTGVTVAAANQRLEITGPASTAAGRWSGPISVLTDDFTDRAIFVRIANAASIGGFQLAFLMAGVDASNKYSVQIQGGAFIELVKWVGGGSASLGTVSVGSDVWFRLRHTSFGNQIIVDSAPSTASDPPVEGDWTQRIVASRDDAVGAITAWKVALNGGLYASVASPTTIQFDGFNTATTSGTALLPASSVNAFFTENSALSVARSMISASASTFSETSALSRLRGIISSASIAASESSALSRLRGIIASTGETWSEISSLTRIRSLAASAVTAALSETSALSVIRRLIGSASQNWSESAIISRLRGLIGSAAQQWSETSALSRVRGLIGNGQESWSEASALAARRGFTASSTATFAELSVLARIRTFGTTSGQIVFSALALMPNAATLISAVAMSFASGSALSVRRGFVGAASLHFDGASALSVTKRMLASGQLLFGEISALTATRTITPTRIIHLGRERIGRGWSFRSDRTTKF